MAVAPTERNNCKMGSESIYRVTIGVLELQGDFAEHTAMLRGTGCVKVRGVRLLEHLEGLDGLVLPGGESTVISKLLVELGMMERVKELARQGLPIFGTCAGCILLAKEIEQRPEQPRIGVLDVSVDRNFYGSQIHSSQAMITRVHGSLAGQPLRVVLIRAPGIVKIGAKVEVLAVHNDMPILVRQGSLLAATFHPELTKDARVHRLFLDIVTEWRNKTSTLSL